ncbi:MAG: glycosyltransferase family 39 protein [Actinomycetota bacterium]|nr:glycosyltransferase family 39 protein [Actinomycetota bacterium]
MMTKKLYNGAFLFIAIAGALSIAACRFLIVKDFPPAEWDAYAFLDLAVALSRLSAGDVLWAESDRPLFLPVLTSLFFRLGIADAKAIYLAAATLFVVGAIGLYLLMRIKLPRGLSLIGVAIFMTSPLVLHESVAGMTNLPGASLAILSIYFLYKGRDNPRFLMLVFPAFVLAFMTRFTEGLCLIPIAVYLLTTGDSVRFGKAGPYAVKGLLSGFLTYFPFGVYYYFIAGSFLYPIILSTEAVTNPVNPGAKHYQPDLFYYARKLPELISGNHFLGYAIAVLVAAAILWRIISILYKTNLTGKVLFSAIPITFGFLSTLVSIASLLPAFFTAARQRDEDDDKYDLVILLWFLVFFILHSKNPIKVDRYFLTMLPQLVILSLLFIHDLVTYLKAKFIRESQSMLWGKETVGAVLAAWISVMIVFISAQNIFGIEDRQISNLAMANSVRDSLKTIALEPGRPVSVASDLYPIYAWFTRNAVQPMPRFSREPRGEAITHRLNKEQYTYFFSVVNMKIPGYKQVYSNPSTGVYGYRIIKPAASLGSKPSAFFLGNGWQRKIEWVSGYSFYLYHDMKPPSGLGDYRMGRSLFIDNYTIDELELFPYVFAYGFKWHNRPAMEKLLRSYVEQGGTLIIDAARNLGSPLALTNLKNRKLLGVKIDKAEVSGEIRIKAHDPSIKIVTDELNVKLDSPMDGALYTSTGSAKLKTLASINGKPLISLQRIGKGKVYWMGFDLFGYTIHSHNPKLADFSRRVLRSIVVADYQETKTDQLN